MQFGLGWAKSVAFHTRQTPVMKYSRGLMLAIPGNPIQIARAVNVKVISLDEAPQAYNAFDEWVAKKFMIDPHNTLRARS